MLLSTLLLAGCAGDPAPAEDPLGEDAFWMIWVAGSESESPAPGTECDVAFDHTVKESEQRLSYEPSTYDLAEAPPRYVVAFTHFQEQSDCPLAYHLNATADTAVATMGRGGGLGIGVATNGSALLSGGAWVEPGEQASFSYDTTYTDDRGEVQVEGSYVVKHLGAWPTSGLQPRG